MRYRITSLVVLLTVVASVLEVISHFRLVRLVALYKLYGSISPCLNRLCMEAY